MFNLHLINHKLKVPIPFKGYTALTPLFTLLLMKDLFMNFS